MKLRADREVRKTIQQAAEWRLLSLLVSRPRDGWLNEIRYLTREITDTSLHEAAGACAAATQEAYLSVFGPGGSLSPREVSYIGFEDPGKMMSDLQHFYHSFRYAPATEDPPDHVAVETGYVGYLALKRAYAMSARENEAAEITETASKHFLERHLARLIYGIASKTQGTEPEYLQKAFRALIEQISHLPKVVEPKGPSEEAAAFHCGL